MKTRNRADRKSAGLRTLASSLLARWTNKKTNIPARPGNAPVRPGAYVRMAYPPPGGTMVAPGCPGGYDRVSVRQDWITDESDLWADLGDWIPGEYECVMSLERPDGTTYSTRDVVEYLVELWAACPAAFTRARLAMADHSMDQTGPEIRN